MAATGPNGGPQFSDLALLAALNNASARSLDQTVPKPNFIATVA